MKQRTVNDKYIMITAKETCAVLGKIFSVVSDDSVLKTCIPPTCNTGSILIAMTIIPTPPIHWRSPRQSRMPSGIDLMSLRIVDPVVVMPDIDSKIESVKLILRFAKKKGREPKIQIKTQDNVVIKNASWVWILFSAEFLVEIKKVIPNPRVIIELIINDCHVSLRKARSNIAGTSKTKLKAINKKPNTLSINLKLSM